VVYLAALDRAGRPDLALPLLEQLAGFYRSLKITDSQFLFGHGMPFFEVFLRNSLSIVRKLKTPEEVRDWYRPIHDEVDEAGKRMFEEGGFRIDEEAEGACERKVPETLIRLGAVSLRGQIPVDGL